MSGDTLSSSNHNTNRTSTRPPFKQPPETLHAAELLDWHIEHNPDWIVAKHGQSQNDRTSNNSDNGDNNSNSGLREITYKELSRAIHSTARYFASSFNIDLDNGIYPTQKHTIAIIANVEPLQYYIVVWAMMRIGLVPFAISTNNSKEAIVHLIKTSGASAVLKSPPGSAPSLDATIDAARQDLLSQQQAPHKTDLLAWPGDHLLFNVPEQGFTPIKTFPPYNAKHRLIGVHSSGSTSFPKPVFARSESITWMTSLVSYGEFSIEGWSVMLSSLPPFHAFSLYWGALSTLGSGITIAVRQPTTPPTPITPQTILQDAATLQSDVFLSVPSLFRAWSRSQEALAVLKNFRICVSAGGPLDVEAAHVIKENGVPLVNLLAASEVGLMSQFPYIGQDPFTIKLHPLPRTILRPHGGDGDANNGDVFEIVIASKGHFHPLVTNDVIDGEPVYATSDLIQRLPRRSSDPTEEEFFTVVGRIDDQIMHSSGEKTNPGPLLTIIERSPVVQVCSYFGRGKPHPGLLVEPVAAHAVNDTKNDDALAEFRNKVWPHVEKANALAPSHSRIYKEMIVVASAGKPLPKTPKGSVRTGVAFKEYSEEIEEAYRRFDDVGTSSVQVPEQWDGASTKAYIRRVVDDVLVSKAFDGGDGGNNNDNNDDKDLFTFGGVNSLTSTKIRNVLNSTLPANTRLEPNFVYTHPTISELAKALSNARSGRAADATSDQKTSAVKACKSMLAKYTAGLRDVKRATAVAPSKSGKHGQVVLLTGSTGGLGAHLLDELLKDDSVDTVYALNRKASRGGGKSLQDRQRDAFSSRGIQQSTSHSKLRLLEADLTQQHFGLDPTHYSELASTVTLIIHNAWQLDFNLSLSSFEPHIKGGRALIDLALSSPLDRRPLIIFTSSIATTSNCKPSSSSSSAGQKVPEVPFDTFDPSIASGYSESKAVVEHLLRTASEETGVDTMTVRIGQLSGSRTNGCWATTDWFSLLVKGGQVLRCLPQSNGPDEVSWIPTDVAARVLLDLAAGKTQQSQSQSQSNAHSVFHLVHPHTASWSTLIRAIAKELDGNSNSTNTSSTQLLSYSTWLQKLESSQATKSPDRLPTLKLLDFFKASQQSHGNGNGADGGDDVEAMMIRRLDTTKAEAASETLRSAARLDAASAASWVAYWRSVGFLT